MMDIVNHIVRESRITNNSLKVSMPVWMVFSPFTLGPSPLLTLLLALNNNQQGDPHKLAQIIADVVQGEGIAAGQEVPLGLPIGSDSFAAIKETVERTQKVLTEWEDVIKSTDFLKGS